MANKTKFPPLGHPPRAIGQIVTLSASVSASVSFPLTNDYGRGVMAFFTIHSLPASASTTCALKIQAFDPTTGSKYTMLAGAARSASGMTVMMVGPGISASALGVSALVPRDLNILLSLSTGATVKDVVFSLGIAFTG